MNYKNSGELYVLLKPGFVFQPQALSDRPLFDKPIFNGEHGYSTHHNESLGIISYNNELSNVVDTAKYILEALDREDMQGKT
ncbi:hypothetical protein [Pleionea sp. CnH1-48]|uniref:hypothetical protein n=1 Tax=Pleionea sp. CnH1-48 TaxID=2954494 RepID=UPI002097C4DC|nr:hypothetical protein [Pleionea sp. CnH1-48]MCO7225592.1 hypothetical protein [Pleionea sp. CnH1-48]